MNIPLFPFFGNKDREISSIMNNLPVMTDIDTIIEPYCGSFSLIRHLLLLYPDKKYICNDNDKDLIDCYKAVQADDSCSELINFFQNFEIRNKQHYDEFKKEGSVRSFLFSHIVYSIRNGMYDKNKHKLNDRDIIRLTHFNKAYKNVEFICGDASVIIDKYKNDKTCFMFLDPPFLMQCSFYCQC